MNFLAIDTSGTYLTAVAYADGRIGRVFLPDCAMKHSIVLMDEIGRALSRAELTLSACDFFAAVVGPGSFTGIRIGISTVKGFCLACEKPALAVTSFDCLAYTMEREKVLAFVDAGHGAAYVRGQCGGDIFLPAAYLTREERERLGEAGIPCASGELFPGCRTVDPSEGLLRAVLAKAGERAPARELKALYLRRSSAEELRK